MEGLEETVIEDARTPRIARKPERNLWKDMRAAGTTIGLLLALHAFGLVMQNQLSFLLWRLPNIVQLEGVERFPFQRSKIFASGM